MPIRISPSFTGDKLSSDSLSDCIDVYEGRVSGWLLRPARALLEVPHSEFAVLHLLLSYFEGWAQYRFGESSKHQSKEFFRRGFLDVFHRIAWPHGEGDRDKIVDLLYDEARCGAFHDGMTRRGVFVKKTGNAIMVTGNKKTGELGAIIIDVEIFLADVESQFRRYITALRDPQNEDLQTHFSRAWERIHAPTRPLYLPPELTEA